MREARIIIPAVWILHSAREKSLRRKSCFQLYNWVQQSRLARALTSARLHSVSLPILVAFIVQHLNDVGLRAVLFPVVRRIFISSILLRLRLHLRPTPCVWPARPRSQRPFEAGDDLF